MRKIIDFIITAVEVIVSIFLIILIVITGFQRFSNSGSFFGYRIYTVASSSMIPIYTVGDTLLIQDTSSDNIEVGDALTYMGESGEFRGKIITHQVIAIDEDENGVKQYHTKGVANQIEDPIVSENQIFGKVIYKFTSLSIIGKITLNMVTLLLCVAVPVALLIAIELIKFFKNDDEEDEDDKIIIEDKKEESSNDNDSNESKNDSITDKEESLESNEESEDKIDNIVEDKKI